MNSQLPELSTIRQAILDAPELPEGFPFQSLRDTSTLNTISNNPTLQAFFEDVRNEADRAQLTPLNPLSFSIFRLFETIGDRSIYQDAYFDRRRRLVALVICTIIDETDCYLPALSDLIWEICNEYTWALPAHLPAGIDHVKAHPLPPEQIVDLFAAETAHTLAELLSIFGNKVDSWLQHRIRTEIKKRIFYPIFNLEHHFEWETAKMNWAAVCGGSIGMVALLLEDDRERLVTIIDRMVRTMECFLSGFGEDGACPEGINYWVYGFGYYTYFAHMLHAYTDGALDLLENEHVPCIAAFPAAVNLGDDNFINYSDASAKATIPPGLGTYLSEHFQQPIPGLSPPNFHADSVYRWGHIIRDLLWTNAKYLYQTPVEGTVYFEHVGWLIDKQRIKEQIIAFSAKGGHNAEPHNHNDLGHFILNVGGQSLLEDLGAGVYTKQYFDEKRYDSLHTGSQGHCVPLINGKTQNAGSAYAATVTNYDKRADGATFSLNLSRAYEIHTLKSYLRSFDWEVNARQNSASLTLTDTFEFDSSPSEIKEYFISLVKPVIEGNTVKWCGQHATLRMTFNDKQMVARVETLQTQTHYLESITVYRLLIQANMTELNYQVPFDFLITLNLQD